MYRCHFCSRVPAAGTPLHRVVTATRPARYPLRRKANVVRRIVDGRWKEEEVDDPGGAGVEIVAETDACPECARLHGGAVKRRPASGQ
jgi:hypothetical protein